MFWLPRLTASLANEPGPSDSAPDLLTPRLSASCRYPSGTLDVTITIASVVGARPQFVKLAPVVDAMAARSEFAPGGHYQHRVIHTGQHYDDRLSKQLFEDLSLPEADVNLEVGSGSHAFQTARMLEGLEAAIETFDVQLVVCYGDTNSTLAAALVAAKLNLPCIHVEAGLRSGDRRMPEEVNRIVADHLCGLLLAPTQGAIMNLRRENLGSRSHFTGDVMLDALERNIRLLDGRKEANAVAGSYVLATIHRADNTVPDRLGGILNALESLVDELGAVVFPAHPRTMNVISAHHGDWLNRTRVKVLPPVGYLHMIELMKNARLIVTDSGGVQKEALFVGTPCVTVRDSTEWPETIELGANRLVGNSTDGILSGCRTALTEPGDPVLWQRAREAFGGAQAANRVVDAVTALLER